MSKPLEGVRVLELAAHIAGPACGRLLADLGADVIKIEPSAGDPWRQTGISYVPGRFSMEENPSYDIVNTGKRSIVLDLKSEKGQQTVHRLLERTDIFFSNFRPDALRRLGLHYEQLRPRYPGLIYGLSLGFGEEGPEAKKKAMDVTAFWSRTGFLRDQCRAEDDHPVMPPWCVGDTVVGTQLALELVSAYVNRLKTGCGDLVKTGLMQESTFVFGHMIAISQPPWGRSFPRSVMENVVEGDFLCRDGNYVFVSSVGGQATANQLARMLGCPELCDDPRFSTPKARFSPENRPAIHAILCEAFLKKTAEEWSDLALEYDLPVTRMLHYSEVANDEQAWANGYLEYVDYPNGHRDVLPASPFKMESLGNLKTSPAHAIGQDTAEILRELDIGEP